MKAARLPIILALCGALLQPLWGLVDDAHSMSMDMATPYVEKGFRVRQEYWKGDVEGEQPKRVRAQLFKGNEYWFWLGCDVDGAQMTLKVLDQAGKDITAETASTSHAVGARVLPPKTGSYTLLFTVKVPEEQDASWALAYGYR